MFVVYEQVYGFVCVWMCVVQRILGCWVLRVRHGVCAVVFGRHCVSVCMCVLCARARVCVCACVCVLNCVQVLQEQN